MHSQHEEVAAIAAADAHLVVEVGHVQRAARRRRRVHGRDAEDEKLDELDIHRGSRRRREVRVDGVEEGEGLAVARS